MSIIYFALVSIFFTVALADTCNSGTSALLTVEDYAEAAIPRLPKNLADYLKRGAGRDDTLRQNYDYMKKVRVIPRYLRDISNLSSSTTILDKTHDMPIGIAPSGLHKRWHPLGEIATARAAASRNTIYIVSSATSVSLEEVAKEVPEAELWMQLFLIDDKYVQNDLIHRAEEAGYDAVVLTIDMPVSSLRYHNKRNQHKDTHKYANMERYSKNGSAASLLRQKVTWSDLIDVVSNTSLPVILKGVMSIEDAIKARDYGARGIIVSNHGGRQIDGTISSIEALAKITAAMPNAKDTNFDIYFDGGIMSGLDAYRAIALGAKFVFAGRAPMYGLTVSGQEGLENVLDILDDELRIIMAQAGFKTVESITRDSVRTEF